MSQNPDIIILDDDGELDIEVSLLKAQLQDLGFSFRVHGELLRGGFKTVSLEYSGRPPSDVWARNFDPSPIELPALESPREQRRRMREDQALSDLASSLGRLSKHRLTPKGKQ